MGRKVKYSAEEKICAIKEYLDGKNSMATIASRLGIDPASFKQWVNNYEVMGADVFSILKISIIPKLKKGRQF